MTTTIGGDPAAGSEKFTFSLDHNFAQGAIQIDPSLHPELLEALAQGGRLPDQDVALVGTELHVATGPTITVGPAKVGFSADMNAALGVFTTPGSLRAALLKAPAVISQIGDSLALPAGDKFLMLRWGYDLSATLAGNVALGPSAHVNFSASGGTYGYFAIAQAVAADVNGLDSITNLIKSWKLPSQVDDVDKIPAKTTLIAEVDGSFQLSAKVRFGYDFNWVRAVDGLGLKGDVGLKLKAGFSASLGFGMTGKYALLVSRETDARTIRIRLYKLRVNGLDLGFSASLSTTPATPPLPENFNDLIKAITGTHPQQIIKLLGNVSDWTDPAKPIFGPFVNLVDSEAQKVIQSLTGVADLASAFTDIKTRIQKLFDSWSGLPQKATHWLWANLSDQQQITVAKQIAQTVSRFKPEELDSFIQSKIGDLPFLNSPEGKFLESLAVNGLYPAIENTAAVTDIRKAAALMTSILDGSDVQTLLANLQNTINAKLDLKQLESVVDQTSFDSLDTWLRARLEDFMEQDLAGAQGLAEIQKLRDGLHKILAKGDDLYAKGLAALKKTYDFTINSTYQSSSTTSALLDANFDFTVPGSQAGDGLKLALTGQFDKLLADTMTGVTINQGVLAFGLHKETHVSISLPYFSTQSTHVNDAVAQLETVHEDAGGLIFSLQAVDTYTVKNDYSSALTIALNAPGRQNRVNIHTVHGASWRYALKIATPNLTSDVLTQQYATYARTYFRQELGNASFADWVKAIAPKDGGFGNALLTLTATLPSSAAGAWMNCPEDQRDPAYKRMSIALQHQFKQILHDTFFANPTNYKNVSGDTPAWAVLAFCSIPPASDAELVNGGSAVKFLNDTASGKTIYWNYRDRGVNIFSVDLREMVLFSNQTKANLLEKLRIAQTRLREAGDPDHVIGSYSDDQIGQILGAALHGKLLDFLFPVEANMVEQARGAGLKLAAFRKNRFANPDNARKDLASFGQTLSADFNTNLKTFAVNTALLPLGTAIYSAGARALDPATDGIATAMFTMAILKAGVTTLDPKDTDILRTERLVHVSGLVI